MRIKIITVMLAVMLCSFILASCFVEDDTVYYCVVFETESESDIAIQTIKEGEKATKPADPTKTGYEFVGWFSDADLQVAFDFNTAITSDTTLYAKWQEKAKYTVSFNVDGGSDIAIQTIIEGEKVAKPSDPTKTGYEFVGWFSDIDLVAPFDFDTAIISDTTIYAKWQIITFTASFDIGGGSDIESQVVEYGEKATKPTNPTKTDYVFVGWFRDIDSLVAFDFNTAITGDITIYAKWNTVTTGLAYELEGQGYVLTGIGTATDTDIVIPNIYNGLPVVAIANSAFYNCTSLKSVIIPDSVTSIGSSAFYGCTSLTEITIPNSVTSIGYYAFLGCYSLVIIVQAESIPSTWNLDWNISNCPVVLPSTQTFEKDGMLFRIDGSSATLIKYRDNASTLDIPSTIQINGKTISVTNMGEYAFYNSTSLISVIIPNSLTSIGERVFYYCTSLTQVTIPNSITSIGNSAFSYCTSLASVIIPDSVTSIGSGAFSDCTSLTSVVIPDSVTSIGIFAFSGCYSLIIFVRAENIPSTWNLDWNISNCLVVLPSTQTFETDGMVFRIDGSSATLIKYWGNAPILDIPLAIQLNGKTISVTSIGENAFYKCTSLISVVIPDSVIIIGERSFYYCTSLTSVTIGNLVASIEEYAFSGCTSLRSVIIPNSVTNIENFVFYDSYSLVIFVQAENIPSTWSLSWKRHYIPVVLPSTQTFEIDEMVFRIDGSSATLIKYCGNASTLDIPSTIQVNAKTISVTGIETYAFYNLTYLTRVTISNSVTSIGNEAFYNCTSLTEIIIPNSVTSVGDSAFSYCTSLTEIVIPNSVTNIGDSAFSYCTSLTEIIIPDSVTTIGNRAFYYCTSLTSVVIPDSVTSLGDYTFYCISLTEIIIPNSVTSIGNNTFEYCKSLIEITIPDSVTSIGDYAFSGCTSLTEIIIPNSVTSIGESTFNGTSLISVIIPDSVTSIGSGAFSDCTSLTSVVIPDSVTSIGAWTFSNSTSLTEITIPNSVTSIGDYTFYGCTSLTSVVFENPNGWYVTQTQGATSGSNLTLDNASTNATHLKSNYYSYYWYRN